MDSLWLNFEMTQFEYLASNRGLDWFIIILCLFLYLCYICFCWFLSLVFAVYDSLSSDLKSISYFSNDFFGHAQWHAEDHTTAVTQAAVVTVGFLTCYTARELAFTVFIVGKIFQYITLISSLLIIPWTLPILCDSKIKSMLFLEW